MRHTTKRHDKTKKHRSATCSPQHPPGFIRLLSESALRKIHGNRSQEGATVCVQGVYVCVWVLLLLSFWFEKQSGLTSVFNFRRGSSVSWASLCGASGVWFQHRGQLLPLLEEPPDSCVTAEEGRVRGGGTHQRGRRTFNHGRARTHTYLWYTKRK